VLAACHCPDWGPFTRTDEAEGLSAATRCALLLPYNLRRPTDSCQSMPAVTTLSVVFVFQENGSLGLYRLLNVPADNVSTTSRISSFASCTVCRDYRNVRGAIQTNMPVSRTRLYTEWAKSRYTDRQYYTISYILYTYFWLTLYFIRIDSEMLGFLFNRATLGL